MGFESTEEYKKIFKFSNNKSLRLLTRESSTIEFKVSFNWRSKDEYAKSVAAFANKQGGFLIFGVKDKPRELVGLQSDKFEEIDEAVISEYLNSLFSPEIEFEKFVVKVRDKDVGVIKVHSVGQKPVVATKNDGSVREGEIYYRYNAKKEKIKFPELRELLDKIREEERKEWMSLFSRISSIGPENAALLDMASGRIEGKTGTLVIDRKLISKLKFIQEGRFHETGSPTLKLVGEVRPITVVKSRRSSAGGKLKITNDPSAPEVRVKEEDLLNEYSLDYKALTKELVKRYQDFKPNKKYHEVRKFLMKKEGNSFTRTLNPKNAKSVKQDFYSPRIIKAFGKFYKKKTS